MRKFFPKSGRQYRYAALAFLSLLSALVVFTFYMQPSASLRLLGLGLKYRHGFLVEATLAMKPTLRSILSEAKAAQSSLAQTAKQGPHSKEQLIAAAQRQLISGLSFTFPLLAEQIFYDYLSKKSGSIESIDRQSWMPLATLFNLDVAKLVTWQNYQSANPMALLHTEKSHERAVIVALIPLDEQHSFELNLLLQREGIFWKLVAVDGLKPWFEFFCLQAETRMH